MATTHRSCCSETAASSAAATLADPAARRRTSGSSPEYFELVRPTITNAPATINYGTTFQVDTPTPADIAEAVILRPGAVTHGFNQSQRGLELVISGAGAGTIDVEAPPDPNLAPPGWYLLFLLNASRVPSIGRWLRVTP